ncbi:MAG: RNA methyltransferase [Elusimicrobiota bacterium]
MPNPAPAVVLVRPRNPLNIGAAARAMSNFGFRDLRVVAPHPPVWAEARRSAPGGEPLLKAARVYPDLARATADRTLVLATSSLKGRRPALPVWDLPGSGRRLVSGRTAFVFGPEKTGLTARDLQHCDALLRIPTSPSCPSMNLGQAVAIVCYELGGRPERSRGSIPAAERPRAPSAQVQRLVDLAGRALGHIGYRKSLTPQARRARVRRLLRRRGLAKDEAGMLGEILRRILEMPERFPPPGGGKRE